jgi:uncharacterized protein (TIGR03086 family)
VSESTSDRYRRVAAGFTARVESVPAGAWENPAPCEGWTARDVVRHLVTWVPGMVLGGAGLPLPSLASVDDDPVAAWRELDAVLQAALDDPSVASLPSTSQAGTHAVSDAIAMFVTGDVLIHTWDLARATGQDETIEADVAAEMLAGMEPIDEVLRSSGHYGPRVAVPADADVQTRLIAFTGRSPL